MQRAIVIILLLLSNQLFSQEIVNGDFEILNSKNLPRTWNVYKEDNNYTVTADFQNKYSGKTAIHIDGTNVKNASPQNNLIFANVFGAISTKAVNKIEISAYLNVPAKKDSAISIFIQDFSSKKIIREYFPGNSKGGWQKLSLTYNIPPNEKWYGFYYGTELSKNIDFRIDNFTLKVDEKTIEDPKAFNYDVSPQELSLLNKNLIPLDKNFKSDDFSDVKKLSNFLGKSKIIGVGEPTHGTSEASKFKLHLLQYLVEKKGFTTFAMEEVIPVCDSMNAIINNPQISLKESLQNLSFYKCWKTEEVLTLLEWIRNYNLSHKKKIRFIGIDMEDSWLKNSLAELSKYQNAYAYYPEILNNIENLKKLNKEQKFEDALTLAGEIIEDFNKFSKAVQESKTLSAEDKFTAQTYIRVSNQWLSNRFTQTQDKTRDQYMAENIEYYFKNHSDEKIMLWAHNLHIANISLPQKAMGAFLKDMFVVNYLPIGFTSASGSYLAAEDNSQKIWKSYAIEPAYKGTYESILKTAKSDFYFLKTNSSNNAEWLNIPMLELDNGYIYTGEDDYKFLGNPINKLFDGLVFCKQTNASKSVIAK
ncbi:MAG: erythromycin esterase family protein [Niabella sp.]